jgi:hypothetical protein
MIAYKSLHKKFNFMYKINANFIFFQIIILSHYLPFFTKIFRLNNSFSMQQKLEFMHLLRTLFLIQTHFLVTEKMLVYQQWTELKLGTPGI